LYLLTRSNLGGSMPADAQIPQLLRVGQAPIFGALAHWRGPPGDLVYLWANGEVLKAFAFAGSGAQLEDAPASAGTIRLPSIGRGPSLAISALGGAHGSGIVWASHAQLDGSGVLRAF